MRKRIFEVIELSRDGDKKEHAIEKQLDRMSGEKAKKEQTEEL